MDVVVGFLINLNVLTTIGN